MVQYGRSSRSSWAESVRSSIGRTCEKGNSRKFFWNTVGQKFQFGNASSLTEKRTILVCEGGKKQNIDPLWKVLIDERRWFGRTNNVWPCLFFGMYSTRKSNKQRHCGKFQNHGWIQNLAGATEKLPFSEKLGANTSSWSCDMEGHAKKFVENIANWQTEQLNNYTKSQHHAPTTSNPSKKKWDLSENCQRFARTLFWNACICRALTDRIVCGLWTNLLVLSKKWTRACGMFSTFDLKHSSHKRTQTILSCGKHCQTMRNGPASGLFCWRSRRLKINIRRTLVHFRKRHVRANKLDVQETDFSFTQFHRSWHDFSRCMFYEWMEFQLLIFGDWIKKCFILLRTNPTTPTIKYQETRRVTPHQTSTPKTKPRFQPSTTILNWVMLITFRRTRSLLDSLRCCTFEDNETVIEMILRERSPTMRHVSRIHRVALDWLFDRNLDLKIQIKFVDTKHQLADVLTEGNFARDEWNHILQLFEHQPFQLRLLLSEFQLDQLHWNDDENGCKSRKENRGSWHSQSRRWTWARLSLQILRHCKIRLHQKAWGYWRHFQQKDRSSTLKLEARKFNRGAASSSQGWQKDAVLDDSTRRLAVTEEDQEHLNFLEDWKSTRRLVASGNSETEGKDKIWPHNFHVSTDCVPRMEMVFSIERQ